MQSPNLAPDCITAQQLQNIPFTEEWRETKYFICKECGHNMLMHPYINTIWGCAHCNLRVHRKIAEHVRFLHGFSFTWGMNGRVLYIGNGEKIAMACCRQDVENFLARYVEARDVEIELIGITEEFFR